MISSTEKSVAPMVYQHVGGGPAEAALDVARVHGHARGYAAGLRAAEAELDAVRTRLEEAAQADRLRARAATADAVRGLAAAAASLDARVLPILEEVEEMIAATALDIAEAVVGCELADGTHGARAALLRALNPATARAVHTVRLHPEDFALLRDAGALEAGVRFLPDAQLLRGDAVAELPEGILDARISASLERARQALLTADRPRDAQ